MLPCTAVRLSHIPWAAQLLCAGLQCCQSASVVVCPTCCQGMADRLPPMDTRCPCSVCVRLNHHTVAGKKHVSNSMTTLTDPAAAQLQTAMTLPLIRQPVSQKKLLRYTIALLPVLVC